VLGAAKSAGAELVVLENLYVYGPSSGPLRETRPVSPTSAKGRACAAMCAQLFDAAARQRRTDVTTLKRPLLRTLGLLNRNDDSPFRDASGGHTTHWGDIVARTVYWYRAQATTPVFSTGLAEATTLKVTA
jgi:hypothetical protein